MLFQIAAALVGALAKETALVQIHAFVTPVMVAATAV